MRFATLLAGSVAVGGAAAVPVPEAETPLAPFMVESGGKLVLDPVMYTTENFTATDGETYEISYLTHVPGGETRGLQLAFHRRQQDSDDPYHTWLPSSSHQDTCGSSSFNDDTGPNAPTTGRCEAVRDWAANNRGHWEVFGGMFQTRFYPLVSSGKAGTTACHFAIQHNGAMGAVGNTDVRDLVNDSLNRYKRDFGGVWRVRAYGRTRCNGVRVGDTDWRLDTLQGIQ